MSSVTPEAALAAARHWMAGRFVWGQSDCCIAACLAFAVLWDCAYPGPMPGSYATATEARARLARVGGYEAACNIAARRHGLIRVEAPVTGALVLIPVGRRHHALTLCVAPGTLAAKSPSGMALLSVDLKGVPAWLPL